MFAEGWGHKKVQKGAVVKVAKEAREGKEARGKGGKGGKGRDNPVGTPSGAGNKKLQHGIKSVFLLYLMLVRCCYKGIIVHLYFDVLGEPSGGKPEPWVSQGVSQGVSQEVSQEVNQWVSLFQQVNKSREYSWLFCMLYSLT